MTEETQENANAEPATGGSPSKDACTMALLAHLLGIVIGFLGPLLIWILKKDDDAFIEDQSKEALNFQLSVLILYVICGATSCLIFPIFIAAAAWIGVLILSIIAAMKANEGQKYRYPLTIRLIK